MKKSISLLLVLAMIFSLWIPALGEEGTGTMDYQDVDDGTVVPAETHYSTTTGRNPIGANGVWQFYANDHVAYKLNFLKSGVYRISATYFAYSQYNPGACTVFIDNEEKGSGIFENKQKRITTEICTTVIEAGQRDFKVKNGPDVSLHGIYSFTFEYLGNRYEYNKDGTECEEADINPSESMEPGATATYTINTFDGTFGVYASVETESGYTALSSIIDDDVFLSADSYGTCEDIYLGPAVLSLGEHTITITNFTEDTIKLKNIKLLYTSVSEEETAEFIMELENAVTRAELDEIFTEYNSKFLVPYADYLDKIFSKEIIYSKLLRFKYTDMTLDGFNAKFMELYNEEIRAPLVEITQSGKSVTELAPGAFTITVNPRLPNEAVVIAALYNDDYTELKATDKGTLTTENELVLDGLTAQSGYTKLKVFFLEDTNKVKPSQLLANETTIFVSPDGKSSNSGLTPDKPATLTSALNKARGLMSQYPRNIIVSLADGEYVLNSTIEIDEDDTTYDEYGISFVGESPDNPPVVSGGYEFDGWSDNNKDGIYEAQLPETITDVRQLYINDYPAQRARSSNYYYGELAVDNENDSTYTQDGFVLNNPAFPSLVKASDAELAYINKWALQRLPVESVEYGEDEEVKIWMEQPYYSTALTMICDGGVHPTVGCRFYVENDMSLLDECGEFYYNKDTRVIYYKPFPQEDLSKAKTVVGKVEQLFTIIGSSPENKVKNISFNNIKFRHGGYYTRINREGAVTFQAENLVDASKGNNQNPVSSGVGHMLDAQILVENAENIEFKDCDISSMGTTALRLGSGVTDSSVTGCIFTDVGGSALSIGTWESARPIAEDITLKNNVIARTGNDFMFCPAVSIYYGKNISTLHNTIAHTPYTAVSINWGWSTNNKLGAGGHETAYNHIYDISNSVVDGGHVYNLSAMTSSYVHDNHLTDSPDFGGVYMDTGGCNVRIMNNVFERCAQYDIMGGASEEKPGNVAKNNWSDDGKVDRIDWLGTGSSYEPIIVVPDGNWPDEAQNVINNAGVESEYQANEARIDKPTWHTTDHLAIPRTEGTDPATTYVHCDTWVRFFRGSLNTLVDSSDTENYTLPKEGNSTKYPVTKDNHLPTFFKFSGKPAIGNFNQNDGIEFEFTVPKDGKYAVALDFNATTNARVYVYIDESRLPINDLEYLKWNQLINSTAAKNAVKFKNVTSDNRGGYIIPGVTELGKDCYIPHFFKENGENKLIELKANTKYYLRLLNGGGLAGFSRFRFKLIEETK